MNQPNERVRITQENPHDAVCAALIAELSAELAALYEDEDGSAGFNPDDALLPRAAFVVAWWKDEAVGCGAIRPMQDAQVAEVKRMYTRPTLRGKGIAQQVLAALENLARDFGYRTLQLETGNLQPAAITLYEKAGYYQIPFIEHYEGYDNSVYFEKRL